MQYTVEQIKRILGAEGRLTSPDSRVTRLLTDSRSLSFPEGTLFFAIPTKHGNGHNYIQELYRRGVRHFVVSSTTECEGIDDADIIVVPDTLTALQRVAAHHRSQFNIPVIGITGSDGKTIVKEWLYQIAAGSYSVTRSPRSYNSQIGVPLSVWQLNEQTELAILEAGISQMGEMARLQPMIQPTIGVITYIGTEHGENFPSLATKRAEKMLLFAGCDTIVEDPTHQNIRTCAGVMRALGYDEDTIAKRILQQTHETILEVNLRKMVENVRYYRSLLRDETMLTCMVKAFGYGAGSVDVSRALQDCGMVDYLAVAVADEGVELRKAGITLPIIIMDPEVAAMDLILENNLQPNIYSFAVLENIIRAAEAKGLEDLPVHIKIDSGMHRLGFYQEDLGALIARLQDQKAVRVASVFSHFAGSDEAGLDDFTHEQAHYFAACTEQLEAGLGYTVIKHICNTAGTERFAEYHYDMCRVGIGLLRGACTLKTTILSIKTVKKGESIGYGRRTILNEDRQIAVIPIGYADGFDRRFSNYGGEVVVRGKRCPVVGNVCMDQAMVDVTGADAQVGDFAVVFGEQLPVEELANKLNTITYEILSSISRRVQRVYLYE